MNTTSAPTWRPDIRRLTGEFMRPGMTTDEVDEYCHQLYIERDSYPSTLNYHHYPKSLCTSANEVICHGIPDSRAMRDGDIDTWIKVTCALVMAAGTAAGGWRSAAMLTATSDPAFAVTPCAWFS